MRKRGYIGAESPESPGQLMMIKKLPLDLNQIYDESLENKRLCEELGVTFDGWGTAVVR